MLNVLVTMRFDASQLDRLRAVSPDVSVSQADQETADYTQTHVLYAGAPPRDLACAPVLQWVQLHMAGVNALADHPLYTEMAVPLTTTSGVHAAAVAEYAIATLLALAHRVPRMMEWQARGGWPPECGALAALRAHGGARGHARHHRLRQHRAGASPDRQDSLRDAGAGL